MWWISKNRRTGFGLIFAALAVPAGAETIAQLFPPPALTPLTMTAVDGTHVFKSEHRGVFDGRSMQYEAAVEEAIVDDPGAVPAADLYTISYVAKGIGNPATRAVMFMFNGGPGGSSVWLHLCAMGPRILRDCSPSRAVDAQTPLIDNHLSPLSVADLVFIDPTDTGWSHTLPGVAAAQFHSVDGDSDEIAALIVWWLRRHERLHSPVYVYGESYGSVRAVAVVRDLARSTPKISVAGLLLGGFCITFGPGSGTTDPVWDAMRLPTAASMAWHYGKIDNRHQTWAQAVDKAMTFARTQYVSALIQGYRLEPEARERIIRQLPALSGLPESYFRAHDTIQVGDFENQLLHDAGLVLDDDNGLWTHPAGEKRRLAPGSVSTQAIEQYARRELGVHGVGPYEIMTPNIMRVFEQWNFRVSGAPSMEQTLAQEMQGNPLLRLMVVQGRYDTLTQVGDTLYVLDQTDIPPSRLTITYFDGGHMLEPKPEAMSAIRGFLARGSGDTVAAGDTKTPVNRWPDATVRDIRYIAATADRDYIYSQYPALASKDEVAHDLDLEKLPNGEKLTGYSAPIDGLPKQNPGPPAALASAKVYVLTDYGCASACLSFVDEMRRFPGVLQIGTQTYIDRRSGGWPEDYFLPSGFGFVRMGRMVRDGRERPGNVPWTPQLRFRGNIEDTAAVKAWVLDAVVPKRGA